jgi:hypothetical protein
VQRVGRQKTREEEEEDYILRPEEREKLVRRFHDIVYDIRKDPEFLKSFKFMLSSLRRVETEIRRVALARSEFPEREEEEDYSGDANLAQAQKELKVS